MYGRFGGLSLYIFVCGRVYIRYTDNMLHQNYRPKFQLLNLAAQEFLPFTSLDLDEYKGSFSHYYPLYVDRHLLRLNFVRHAHLHVLYKWDPTNKLIEKVETTDFNLFCCVCNKGSISKKSPINWWGIVENQTLFIKIPLWQLQLHHWWENSLRKFINSQNPSWQLSSLSENKYLQVREVASFLGHLDAGTGKTNAEAIQKNCLTEEEADKFLGMERTWSGAVSYSAHMHQIASKFIGTKKSNKHVREEWRMTR